MSFQQTAWYVTAAPPAEPVPSSFSNMICSGFCVDQAIWVYLSKQLHNVHNLNTSHIAQIWMQGTPRFLVLCNWLKQDSFGLSGYLMRMC